MMLDSLYDGLFEECTTVITKNLVKSQITVSSSVISGCTDICRSKNLIRSLVQDR